MLCDGPTGNGEITVDYLYSKTLAGGNPYRKEPVQEGHL